MSAVAHFLKGKRFHPAKLANQKLVYIAEQKNKDEKKRESERMREREQEQELIKNRALLRDKRASAETKKKILQQDVSFMYQAPPGLKISKIEEEKEEQENSKDKTKHEEDVERFPMLAHAPVEGQYTEHLQVTHKPFGIQIRNVRCTKCGQWGHKSFDKECALRDTATEKDMERAEWEDPMNQFHNSKTHHTITTNTQNEDVSSNPLAPSSPPVNDTLSQTISSTRDGFALKKGIVSSDRGIRGAHPLHQMIPTQEDDNLDLDDDFLQNDDMKFLAGLSKDQRKKLLKKLKKEEKRTKKKERKEKKEKKDKKKKKHHKKESDSDSKSSSNSESDENRKHKKSRKEHNQTEMDYEKRRDDRNNNNHETEDERKEREKERKDRNEDSEKRRDDRNNNNHKRETEDDRREKEWNDRNDRNGEKEKPRDREKVNGSRGRNDDFEKEQRDKEKRDNKDRDDEKRRDDRNNNHERKIEDDRREREKERKDRNGDSEKRSGGDRVNNDREYKKQRDDRNDDYNREKNDRNGDHQKAKIENMKSKEGGGSRGRYEK